MSYEFEDTYTLDIKAEWLNVFQLGDCISSPRRPVPKCNNLFWWIQCRPNGWAQTGEQKVSILIFTSAGGFELTITMTVLRSDIRRQDTEFRNESGARGRCKFISHDKLRLGDTIKDGVFSIKVDVKFKIPKKTIDTLSKLELFKDSYTIKFDRKTLKTHKPEQSIVEQKQTVGGITWWIEYCPCNGLEMNADYVSVYFYMTGGPIRMNYSCAMMIDGVQIQKTQCQDFEDNDYWFIDRCFSHKLVKLADHKNGIIDIVCEVEFFKPITARRIYVEQNPTKTFVNDSITISILECQLDDNEIGEFDSTPKEFVKDSDKHQWRLKWFPAGDSFGGKRHISLFVEASTTETKTVTMSGIIRIIGTAFEKRFNMIVETDSILAFPNLVTHNELRQFGGIVDNKVTITCDATFHTFDYFCLN